MALAAQPPHGAVVGAMDAKDDLPAAIAPLPLSLWTPAGIALANGWLSRRWCKPGFEPIALARALFPLNDARWYFAGYGKPGLVELQWLIPHPRFEAFAAALGERVMRDRPRIALISSKLFDGVARGFALDGKGIALALHLPAPTQSAQRAFCERVAELAIEHGGRPNPIKDSTLDAAIMRRAFSGFEAMRDALAAHNRDGRFGSELTRRLGL